MRLTQNHSEFGFQTISLFFLDGLANLTDFIFHFWMGRVLVPSDFAILQTLNSVLLVYVTASAVFQPVLSRFVAEARARGQDDSIPGIFQSFIRAAFWLGLALGTLVFLFSNNIAQSLNLPAWTIRLSTAIFFLSTLRPIAVGVLQGQERFIPFGLTRFASAISRLVFGIVLVSSGLALSGAVSALPFGALIGLSAAFIFLGQKVWKQAASAPQGLLREGWKLSFYALLAYLAYMSLTSLDLVWVNRALPGDLAGAYASLIVLRRVVALLPGVAVVVMVPRIARELATGNLPDRLLIRTITTILVTGAIMSLIYFAFSQQLISIVFGTEYLPASNLLGWMGVAMIGVSLGSVWLNFYLAHKPCRFVIPLGAAVALEWLLLNLFPPSMAGATLAFGTTGWLLSLGGLALYLFQVRPVLRNARA